ncbi:MAG TPA: hypothetical protein VFW28_17250 [Micropepsaceae bacterium]|nr:hypothetical protein [Micropepsaceae bacterium]
MSDHERHDKTEYMDRAKKLRDTASQVQDARLMQALISSAEAYERMAQWLVEDA